MVRKLSYIVFILIYSLGSLAQEVEIDFPETVVSNQQFSIEFTVKGNDVTDHSISGDPSQITIVNPRSPSISRQRFSQILNGAQANTISTIFSYTAKPAVKEGKIDLPKFTVRVDGKTLTSEPATINVVPISALTDREKYVASLELSSNTIFEGETVIAELKLYLSEEANKVETDGMPSVSGLFIERQDQNGYEQGQSLFNGKLYNHAVIARYEITGDTAKTYSLPSIEVTAIKRVVQSGTGFFRSTKNVPTVISTTPKTLKVLPLTGEKTANYLGVFEQLELETIAPLSNSSSEALELSLTLSGTGSFNTIATPNLKALERKFSLFQPAIKEEFNQTNQGQKGSITYTYTMVPRGSGRIESDSIELQYFNSITEQFEYLTIPSFVVNVKDLDSETSEAYIPVKDSEFTPYPVHDCPDYSSQWFSFSSYLWALVLILFGLLSALLQRFLKEKKRTKENEKPPLTPQEEYALSMATLKSKPIDKEFPGDLLQIIENYIVGTYPIERSKFSKESLEEYLPESSALDLKRLLMELELDEYAGVAARRLKSENGKKELLDNLELIINQLEKE